MNDIWVTVPLTGDGSEEAPISAEVDPGMIWVRAAANSTECLILVRGNEDDQMNMIEQERTLHVVVSCGTPLNEAERAILTAEALRLGAPEDWNPDGFCIYEGV